MDPFDMFSVEKVSSILKELDILDRFLDKGGLDFVIQDGGTNISQGEKQLLCMARALLNSNKLILLDEAELVLESYIKIYIYIFF